MYDYNAVGIRAVYETLKKKILLQLQSAKRETHVSQKKNK